MANVEQLPLLEPGAGFDSDTHPIQPSTLRSEKPAIWVDCAQCREQAPECAGTCERGRWQSAFASAGTVVLALLLATACALFLWTPSAGRTPGAEVIRALRRVHSRHARAEHVHPAVKSGTRNPAFLVKAYNGVVATGAHTSSAISYLTSLRVENQNCSSK